MRKNLPKRRLKRRKQKKRVIPVRYDEATLRRVWARSQFEPSGSGYLHSSDFGYLEYDIWEHTDRPPQGETVGLINRQVILYYVSYWCFADEVPALNTISLNCQLKILEMNSP